VILIDTAEDLTSKASSENCYIEKFDPVHKLMPLHRHWLHVLQLGNDGEALYYEFFDYTTSEIHTKNGISSREYPPWICPSVFFQKDLQAYLLLSV